MLPYCSDLERKLSRFVLHQNVLVQNHVLVALLVIKGFFSKIYLNIKHPMYIVSFGLKRPFMPSRKWRHLRLMMYNHNMAQSAKSVKVSVD